MAHVKIVPIKPDLPGDRIWTMILNYLTLMESVEVIVKKSAKGDPRFELHVWDAARADGSNTADLDPAKDY